MKASKVVLLFLALLLCISIASANTATYSGKVITIYSDSGQKGGTYTSTYPIQDLDVKNNVMYISTSNMLKAVSISVPKYPVGIQSEKGNFKQAVIKNNMLYAIKDGKITLYNIANKKPVYVTEYPYKSPAKTIDISGSNFYVIYDNKDMNIYSILKDGKLKILPPGV